jgi:hypothetical protein
MRDKQHLGWMYPVLRHSPAWMVRKERKRKKSNIADFSLDKKRRKKNSQCIFLSNKNENLRYK